MDDQRAVCSLSLSGCRIFVVDSGVLFFPANFE